MAWMNVPGLVGKVYVPDHAGQILKKHPCKACFSCQWCDENRCRVCRGDRVETDEVEKQPCCRHRQPVRPAKLKFQTPDPR